MQRTSLRQIQDALAEVKLPKNRVIMVHSGILKFGLIENGLSGLVELLLDQVGPQGTLLMPAFSLNFGQTRQWDYHLTPSDAGALTEYYRCLPDTVRTLHPFHSVSVLGQEKSSFSGCNNISSFGPGSPFDLLYQLDAFNLSLGTEFEGSATFLHHTEEEAGVPYRYRKRFPGSVYDSAGNLVDKIFTMYARVITDRYQYLTDWNQLWPLIEDLFAQTQVGLARICLNRIQPVHDRFKKILLADPFFATFAIEM